MHVLGNICENRENGFNFLRLLAASGILVAHCLLAVPVTIGSIEAFYAEFALAADLLRAGVIPVKWRHWVCFRIFFQSSSPGSMVLKDEFARS